MATRKYFQSNLPVDPELEALLREARTRVISDEEFREQRISFAYGNAMSDSITKESVRRSAEHIRLKS
jgi:hypothetical protein